MDTTKYKKGDWIDNRKICKFVEEKRGYRIIEFKDGKYGYAAMTDQGVSELTLMAHNKLELFKDYKIFKLMDDTVYLILPNSRVKEMEEQGLLYND